MKKLKEICSIAVIALIVAPAIKVYNIASSTLSSTKVETMSMSKFQQDSKDKEAANCETITTGKGRG